MFSWNILITESLNYSPYAINKLNKIGKIFYKKNKKINNKINIIVIRLNHFIDRDFLSEYPNLKIIISPTTGLNHIDQLFCKKKQIKIYSLNDIQGKIINISSTAEHSFGLMISLLRKIPAANNEVIKKNRWRRENFRSRQLSNLNLGIIGFGRIGRMMARYCKSFKMNTIIYDPKVDPKKINNNKYLFKNLRYLLMNSDIISIHAKLENPKTIIGKSELSILKKGSYIINTSRGFLIDEKELVNRLKKGYIGGVAVDVLQNENSKDFIKTSPLIWAAKNGYNVIVTPHIGGCTFEAMHQTEDLMADFLYEEIKHKKSFF